ncbi:MAG: hypothetical protein JZU53_08845 [Paludibacter sp.]|nr:hypothetical protein [Paludibacter sp.]
MKQVETLDKLSRADAAQSEFLVLFRVFKVVVVGPVVLALSIFVIVFCIITDLLSFAFSRIVKSGK